MRWLGKKKDDSGRDPKTVPAGTSTARLSTARTVLKSRVRPCVRMTISGIEKTISDEALKVLLNYDWPGNIRELENCLERACALSTGNEIQIRDLPTTVYSAPAEVLGSTQPSGAIVPIAELERQTILNALAQVNGDKMLAARLLGIGKTTLYRKLKEYASQN